MSRALSIDIWSDVMCPWCAIGYYNLAQAIEQLDGEIDVTIRWMPFELNPDMPPEGEEQQAHLARKYGRTPVEASDMAGKMRAVGEQAGFQMHYHGEGDPPPAMMWNTFEAHKLLRWALAFAGPEAQTRLKLALFRAHFQYRRRIGEREVLLDIAEEEGLPRMGAAEALDDPGLGQAIRLEQRRAYDANITGVPAMIVGGRFLIPGAQEPDVYVSTLRRMADRLDVLAEREAAGR
ncbi:MAG: DsbA family oxidoreductase [Sphingomonadaceae bacterium]|nr:DsbA family oxidoreductase [Sphingomonadaceae bacterium]